MNRRGSCRAIQPFCIESEKRPDDGPGCFLVWVVDYQGVPVEIEDDDPPAFAGYPDHLRERLPGIGEVLQQPGGAAHVEGGIGERKRLHLPDLKGDGEPAFAGALPGFSDHDLARVEPESPNGHWITFNIAPEVPNAAVMAVHPNCKGLRVLRRSDNRFRFFKPVWSPHGRKFLVGCHDVRAQIDKLCVMNANGRNLHIVVATPDPVNFPAWGTHPLKH